MKKPIKKHHGDIFFFGVVFAICFVVVFSVIKQTQNPTFKKGLNQSAEILTKDIK